MTLDLLITDFKSRDEFEFFRNVVISLKNLYEANLKQIVQTMVPAKQEFLKQVIQSQRIVINDEENMSVPRKIVSVRGKRT